MSHKISSGSRTGPERSAVDLSKLLGYYLACVEEEDRRSLQLSADPKYRQFVTPPGQPGALFLGEAEIDWSPSLEDLRFLDKYSSEVAKQRFLYGYPIFHEDDGYITPLFFSEVEIERPKEGRRFRIRLSHPGNIQVNLHLFRATHSMALERMDIQDHLEGPDFGTIDARIAAALAKLGAPAKDIGSIATPAGKAGWKNAAVVFRDSGAVFTAQLRRELADLKSKHQAATGTALGALLGTPAATPSQKPRLLEVTPLNRSQRAAVESAISSPLTVITGPPGTGKSQVVVAMLASFGAAGAPALFASKNNQAVDVVRERLASILGEADWFLRLGSKANIEGELTKRIDEASQCDIASAIPLLLRAKRLVVIGDPKQLRHISSLTEHTDQKLAAEQQATSLLTKYSYRTKSLYDCAAEAVEALGESPFFLDEHYRSHPEIVEFSNRLYYQRRLVLRSPPSTTSEQAVSWHDVPARLTDERGSLINPTEAQAVRDLVLQIASAPSFQPDWTIGVVTPFRRQRDRLEQLLQAEPSLKRLGNRVRIGTVHTFQGAEVDVMVFSPVIAAGARPKAAEWISKEEGLLNVALTRARRALHIVGDKAFCGETPGPLGELAKFISQRAGAARGARRDSPAVEAVRGLLRELNIWFQEEVPETTQARTYYLDFVVVGLSGARYDIEVDGRQHFFTAAAIAEDASRDSALNHAGYKIIRLQAADVTADGAHVRELLGRLA